MVQACRLYDTFRILDHLGLLPRFEFHTAWRSYAALGCSSSVHCSLISQLQMQGSRETTYFTPLLFTKKKDDQEQPSASYTTPWPSRSPRSPTSAGLSASRRRSLTPTGSTALQPAEPPLASLYDDTVGVTRPSVQTEATQLQLELC